MRSTRLRAPLRAPVYAVPRAAFRAARAYSARLSAARAPFRVRKYQLNHQ